METTRSVKITVTQRRVVRLATPFANRRSVIKTRTLRWCRWVGGLGLGLALAFTLLRFVAAERSAVVQPARLGARATVQAAGRGYPNINLRDGRDLLTGYADARSQALLEDPATQPLALASGDLDEDGTPDLLSGYASANGGVLSVQRGNVDALYPDTAEARQRRAAGEFTAAPFLSPARAFALPVAADFVGAGDFNADGHGDVVIATRGGATMYWLAGDGRGGLGEAQAVALSGGVTALTVGEINRADGLADVVVGLDTQQALVFEGAEGAFRRAPEAFALPAAATALALGQLDEGYEMDLAVAAGHELLVVHGRDRRLSVSLEQQAEVNAAEIETHALSFRLASLVVGDFSGDARNEIAVLSDSGIVQVFELVGQVPNLPHTTRAFRSVGQVGNRPHTSEHRSDKPIAPMLVRARVSVSGHDDLIVVAPDQQQLQVLTSEMWRGADAPVTLAVEGEPVAVLPLRLNADALSDLVILKRGGASALAATLTAPTATFTVNRTGNEDDANQSDALCDVDLTTPGEQCTLRAAIATANRTSAADEIRFTVSSVTVPAGSSLGTINQAVTIDGGAGRVEITGVGLSIGFGACVIRNLVINRANFGFVVNSGNNIIEGNYIGTDVSGANAAFGSVANWTGIALVGGANNLFGGTVAAARNVIATPGTCVQLGVEAKLQGNYLGTDATGSKALGSQNGVVANAAGTNSIIGGTEPGAGNLIAGHSNYGIHLLTSGPNSSSGNRIQGNYIGTDATGTKALGNRFVGVNLSAGNGNTVGGTVVSARNLISGTGNNLSGSGVRIDGGNNLIQGNYIGTDVNGANNLGNGVFGVEVSSNANNNLIGGTVGGASNIIAFNGRGIDVNGTENTARRNSIFSNAVIGITSFSARAPVLTANGGTLTGAAANRAHVIEFYSNPTCGTDAQGKTYLGETTVTTNASGAASFSIPAGQNVTATATATGGNTSAFSNCVGGGAAGTLTLTPATLSFNAALGSNPAAQTLALSNSGGAALNWQAAATTTSGGNWLAVTPATGSLNAGQAATLTATVNASALAAGTYNGTLTVTSANAGNSPRTVAVTLTVTGCAAALSFAATAPEQTPDTLELLNPLPGNGTPLSGSLLKLGGLKVTARYLLQSRANATLAVRLFDQAGNRRGDAGEITLTRLGVCPNPLPTREFVFTTSSFDLTPNVGGVEVTSLTLSALLIDPATGAVLKRADVNYRVIPDAVAFEGTPKINGQDAPDGSRLPASGAINFTSVLRYHLTNDVAGKLRVQAFNANGGGQLASKDFGPVTATAQPTSWTPPLDLQFTLPANVSEISVVVSLLAENGAVLKSSTPLFYRNKLAIEMGVQVTGGRFIPFRSDEAFDAGQKLGNSTARLALKVKNDLPDNLRSSNFDVLLAQRLNTGELVRGPFAVQTRSGDDFPRPSFILEIGGVVPDDVDKWVFQLLMLFIPIIQVLPTTLVVTGK